jgi:hypothetical protein
MVYLELVDHEPVSTPFALSRSRAQQDEPAEE